MSGLWLLLQLVFGFSVVLAPGALVVSNSFPIPGRKPDEVVEVGDGRATRLYVYRVTDRRASK